ncbi:right-handed parallel beta-helix repeat-containing protein [Sphingobium sp. 3R8]|uniref:right-handed parallel beta-helix repeat-containing protein n=1 Tax=Sphingobium sp. 3R8 TaxID=2874921 RepID=UPI001CCF82E0|nr:right-handed parallel beta-helix repeat-containing protein [Sphingobium sp. 3R8]MBZ9647038.1 right-handed parallel beta-helix repeat-containing protein [Sphingobium sp. 3R8]
MPFNSRLICLGLMMLSVVFLGSTTAVAASSPQSLTIRVAPGSAISTLAAGIAEFRRRYRGEAEVRIAVAPGVYRNETVVLDPFAPSIRQIVIAGSGKTPDQTIFDGSMVAPSSLPKSWLSIKAQYGRPSNVIIENITVRNYRQAIIFYGSKQNAAKWNGGNIVRNMSFRNIGVFGNNPGKSFSAIILVNSRNNIISNNYFFNIENVNSCRGMHSIYLRSMSSNNRIENNIFEKGCGDQIKFRDASNNNIVSDNTFINQSGFALAVDSYCVKGREGCATTECPSKGNSVLRSRVKSTDPTLAAPSTVRTVGPAAQQHCEASFSPRLSGKQTLLERIN